MRRFYTIDIRPITGTTSNKVVAKNPIYRGIREGESSIEEIVAKDADVAKVKKIMPMNGKFKIIVDYYATNKDEFSVQNSTLVKSDEAEVTLTYGYAW